MADKKQTLEAALLARRDDPRALRGAITIVKGKPRIVFGVVGDHGRFSVDVKGNKMTLCDDPCVEATEPAEDEAVDTQEPETGSEEAEAAPEDDGGDPDASDAPETAVDAEADAEVVVDEPEGEDAPLTAAEKKAKRKAERQRNR